MTRKINMNGFSPSVTEVKDNSCLLNVSIGGEPIAHIYNATVYTSKVSTFGLANPNDATIKPAAIEIFTTKDLIVTSSTAAVTKNSSNSALNGFVVKGSTVLSKIGPIRYTYTSTKIRIVGAATAVGGATASNVSINVFY